MATQELEAVDEILSNVQPQIDTADTRMPLLVDRSLRTAYFYKLITFRGKTYTPARLIWDRIIPHKHRIFLWIGLRDRHNTRDNMLRKNRDRVVSHNGCDLCPAAETMSHILLWCKLAQALWSNLGLQELPTSSIEPEIFLFSEHPRALHGKLWHILFVACAVTLWNARNAQVFDGSFWQERQVYNGVTELIRLWSLPASEHARQSLLDWAAAFAPS